MLRVIEFICNEELEEYSLSTKEGTKKLKVNNGYIKTKELIDLIAYGVDRKITIIIEKSDEELKYYIESDKLLDSSLLPSEIKTSNESYKSKNILEDVEIFKGSISLENIDGLKQGIIEEIYYATKNEDFRIEVQLQKASKNGIEDILNCVNEKIQYYQVEALKNISKQENLLIEALKNIGGAERATYTISNVSHENKIKNLESAFSILSSTANVFITPVITISSKNKAVRELISIMLTNYSKKSGVDSLYTVRRGKEFDDLNVYQNKKKEKINNLDVVDFVPSEYVASLVTLPTKSITGIHINRYVEFGSNDYLSNNQKVIIGNLVKKEKMNTKIHIDLSDSTKHILVAGVTGSGKTTTVKSILLQLHIKGIPFLIFEPAKTEYRSLKNEIPELEIYRLGINDLNNFQINAFEFETGINLQTHMDYLKSVFIAAFPMYGPMPYILEQAIYKIYEDYGWDFISGKNIYQNKISDRRQLFPTMSDLYNAIDNVTDAVGYSSDTQSDVKGALKVRIGSMITGAKGKILNTNSSFNIEKILKNPTVLELENIGDNQEKVFLMGMILIKIYEYYISQGKHRKELLNLLVIEEAHRLLENVKSNSNNEVADIKGKAMELFNDILSEVRTYGQGILVAEQIPSKISSDVIKNTNLKIIHRLYAEDDRMILAKSVGLTDEQSESIIRLRTGRAIVFHDKLNEPVMVDVPMNDTVLASNDQMDYSFIEKNFDVYEYLLSNKKYLMISNRIIGSFLIRLSKEQFVSTITLFVEEEFNHINLDSIDFEILASKTLTRYINNEGKHFFFKDLIERLEVESKIYLLGIDGFIAWIDEKMKKEARDIDVFSEYTMAIRFLESSGLISIKKRIVYQQGVTQSSKISQEILNKSGVLDKIQVSMFSDQELESLSDAVMIILLENYPNYLDEYFEITHLDVDDISRYWDLESIKKTENNSTEDVKNIIDYSHQMDKLIKLQNEVITGSLKTIERENLIFEKNAFRNNVLMKLLIIGQISSLVFITILVLLSLF
jgi:hypothetical protein